MDEIDIAQANQEIFERRALQQQLATMPKGESAKECQECGEPIPEGRRKAYRGCTRCIDCETAFERPRNGR